MNVFDFDGTIYQGDSSVDFFLYCIKQYPQTRKRLLVIVFHMLQYKLGILKVKQFKEHFFSMVRDIDDVDIAVKNFWDLYYGKINEWYLKIKARSDVIISASPEFLLAPLKEMLEIQKVIGTRMDCRTGAIEGENCKGEEKVKRLREEFVSNMKIDDFYSDSKSDECLAEMAQKAFYVNKGKVNDWDFS